MALTAEKIDQLAELGNVYFQISLDGVSGETNFARNGNNQVVEKIMENIGHILKKGMGLEINCVLTKYNTGLFERMLEYFKGSKNFVIMPRPVRGEPKNTLNFNKDQVNSFKKAVIDNYETHSDILPPKQYLERLIYMMEKEHRNWNCYIPFYVMGVNNYGDVNTCTCTDDLPALGNIFDNAKNISKVFEKYENYTPTSRLKPCSYCITQYEMINLYTDGLISKTEMQKIPSFKIHGVMETIDEIKKKLIDLGMVK